MFLAGVDHGKRDAHLLPGVSLLIDLEDRGSDGLAMAKVQKGGQRLVHLGGNVAKLGAVVVQGDGAGVVRVVGLRDELESLARLELAQDLSAVPILESCNVERG